LLAVGSPSRDACRELTTRLLEVIVHG
jgi:hypothetical protein